MIEIGVGIRIDPEEGLSFRGIDQVNGLINLGASVVSIEPGGAIMRKLGEDDDDVRLTLGGCEMKVVLDDSAVESSPQMQEHNRLFQEGSSLVSSHMQLADRPTGDVDPNKVRTELERGIELLRQAAAINPANWSAHWIIGKGHQALGDSESAYEAFGKSFELHKGDANVAREYMFECLNLGHAEKGIYAARHATKLEPDNPGLVANLALALLIGGELEEAAEIVQQAIDLAPDDEITRNVQKVISAVRTGSRPQPKTMSDL